jgi:RIO-like serine/threonine protein kinase
LGRSNQMDYESIDYLASLVAKGDMGEHHTLLGEGLSGNVFSFENYAVKVYKEDFSENSDHLMLQQLDIHPLFPKLHFQDDKFIVVDQVKGNTLAEIRDAGYKLKDAQFRQLEQAVEECYAQGIIPHDIHLNNIMVDPDGNVKIIDVGRFFYSDHKEDYQEKIREDLENIKYHCGLFGLFSSSKRKRRHRHTSSSNRHHRRHSSSSSRHHRRRRHSRPSFSFS